MLIINFVRDVKCKIRCIYWYPFYVSSNKIVEGQLKIDSDSFRKNFMT